MGGVRGPLPWRVGEAVLTCGPLPVGTPRVYIDGYGRSYYRRVEVLHGGTCWTFLFHPEDKAGLRFRGGLFVDASACPGRHLDRVPCGRRTAFLVESPNEPHFQFFPDLDREFVAVLTHHRPFLRLGGPYRQLDYGTRWVPAGDPGAIADGVPKSANLSFFGSVRHPDRFGYGLRAEVAAACALRGVDCFGRGLKSVPEKADGITPYRFSVAMENTRAAGYYTEKLIDCLECGTVPVYWGDPTIGEWLDPRGVVTFGTLEELLNLLPTFTPARYAAMRPYLAENLRRAAEMDVRTAEGLYRRTAAALDTVLPAGTYRRRGRLEAVARYAGRSLLGHVRPVGACGAAPRSRRA